MQTLPDITGKSESKEYRIVRLSKTNLADVAKLHAAVYGVQVAADYFPRKYNTAYTGVEYVGVMAYNAGNIPVAYYGVIPCFIQYGNTVMLAAQSADTMTHPEFRYKGMFSELSGITFNLCRELGIRLLFGFPNQNFYQAAGSRLGWKTMEIMKRFTIPVKCLPLQSFSNKGTLFKKIYEHYSRPILEKMGMPLNGVANPVLDEGFAGISRSDAYLKYKKYNPTNVIAVGNTRIWISTRYGLTIGDIEGVRETNFIEVVNELKQVAKKLGIRQIQFHCCSGTKLCSLFTTHFQATDSYPLIFQDLGSVISPEKIKFSFADIDIF